MGNSDKNGLPLLSTSPYFQLRENQNICTGKSEIQPRQVACYTSEYQSEYQLI